MTAAADLMDASERQMTNELGPELASLPVDLEELSPGRGEKKQRTTLGKLLGRKRKGAAVATQAELAPIHPAALVKFHDGTVLTERQIVDRVREAAGQGKVLSFRAIPQPRGG